MIVILNLVAEVFRSLEDFLNTIAKNYGLLICKALYLNNSKNDSNSIFTLHFLLHLDHYRAIVIIIDSAALYCIFEGASNIICIRHTLIKVFNISFYENRKFSFSNKRACNDEYIYFSVGSIISPNLYINDVH